MLVVWGMFPLEIADPASYAGLMSQVVQHAFPFPWCHHIRVILRDDTERPALRTVLGQQPRIAWYEPDTSLQAMERSLEEEAGDEDLPLEQRMQAVLVTAGMDCGNRRFDQAMDKYQLLFKYYANQKNLALTALTLNSIGEVQLAQGKTAEAADSFLAALLPASEGTSPPLPVLTTVVLNLSRLRSSEKNWAEAEGYCTELHRLAVIQRNSPLKVYAIEQLGEAQHEQGKVGAALESWTAGATVAEKLELPEQRRSILQRMRSAYQRQGDLGKCREIDQVLVGMERKLAAAQS
jgi:tetratricopeptide (TPR) repeat protein